MRILFACIAFVAIALAAFILLDDSTPLKVLLKCQPMPEQSDGRSVRILKDGSVKSDIGLFEACSSTVDLTYDGEQSIAVHLIASDDSEQAQLVTRPDDFGSGRHGFDIVIDVDTAAGTMEPGVL